MNVRRIIEGVVIAAAAGACAATAASWASTKVLSERLDRQQHEIADIKRDVRELRRDLYQPRFPDAMLESDLITTLKASLNDAGRNFETEDYRRHIRVALRKMATQKRPRTLAHTIELEAGQPTYPAPEDMAEVKCLMWGLPNREPWNGNYPGPAPLVATAEQDGVQTLWLRPAPSERQVRALDGKAELLYYADHELVQVPPVGGGDPDYEIPTLQDSDHDLVILRAQAEACRELAFRGMTKPVTLRDGGGQMTRNQTPRALYEALLQEWRDQ